MWTLLKNVRLMTAMGVVGIIAAVAVWPEPIAVDQATVVRGAMQVTIDEEGETRVRERFVVSAPVAGHLQRIELEPGDAVAQGAVVARLVPAGAPLLDPRAEAELTAAVAAARAAVGRAAAERERAAAGLERARSVLLRRDRLIEAGAVSREDLETARSDVRTAESDLRATEAVVDQATYQLELARARLRSPAAGGRPIELRAPVTGMVLKRLHESDAVVPAGEALIEIGNPSEIEVVSDLLSTDAVCIHPGDAVWIEQWGGLPLRARVRRVEPSGFMKVSALGVEEQRVNVVIDFVDPVVPSIGDGYRVEVRIVTWRADNAITVPVASVFRHGAGWAVFVVNGRQAELRPVEIGQRNDEVSQILRGVEAGETVVVHPPDTLTPGARLVTRQP